MALGNGNGREENMDDRNIFPDQGIHLEKSIGQEVVVIEKI